MTKKRATKRASSPSPALEKAETPQRIDATELLALLGRDLQRVQEELAAVGAAVSWPSAPEVANAAQDLKHSVGAFLEKAQATSSSVGRQAVTQSKKLHLQMEDHPVAAVSSAFALGYFLGRTVFGREGRD